MVSEHSFPSAPKSALKIEGAMIADGDIVTRYSGLPMQRVPGGRRVSINFERHVKGSSAMQWSPMWMSRDGPTIAGVRPLSKPQPHVWRSHVSINTSTCTSSSPTSRVFHIHLLETQSTARRSTHHGLASTVVYPLPCIRLDGALSAHLTPHEMGSACSRPPKQISCFFAAVSAMQPSTGHLGPHGCMQVMAKREDRRYLASGQPDRRRQR